MSRLFGNREATFWLFQVLAWSGFGVVRLLQGYSLYGQVGPYMDTTLVAAVTGFVLSSIMRQIYQRVFGAGLIWVAVAAIGVSGAFAVAFSAVEITTVRLSDPANAASYSLFDNLMLDGFVLLAWSAIYFGVKFYRQLLEQQAATARATAMAHEAQLAMLRYQLNPHFLFNTLNAISTLVLEGDARGANAMLTKLSSFLRYSLVNQPTQRVTLAQEVEALKLYLDIERVRFGDRLTFSVDLDESARDAMVPSLLLQPMIENAIKYAIAPSEAGGAIALIARAEAGRLCLRVRDDGPGIQGTPRVPVAPTSSGVGLANTRARLREVYGDDYRFDLANRSPRGLDVVIDIPVQYEPRSASGRRGRPVARSQKVASG
ncbi:hypothetical protein CCR85_11950 [Rhodothalassium salexigens]|uniref:sensor histidine kinase n=1 Tax=Rhodothalassium salexigens TaxID=1086 RepID=UPI00191471AE|nr:histidine kinase [Rhodothalassium salexigens]MBK5912202.1 hypothetical protein [Rhodothalassium salexigens]